MPISSQAPEGEGSETIPQGSRPEVGSKRPAPTSWGDEIVQSSRKREAALKALVIHCSVAESGCWEFSGSRTLNYGSLRLPDIHPTMKLSAHRLAWVAFKGEPIPAGMFVCHHCDNPPCFNPDHLFLGTQKQNLVDCASKDRTMTGERNGNNKYSEEQIDRVRELILQGYSGVEIHAMTGISKTHISRVRKGYAWKHKTAPLSELVHGNRKYSDQQIQSAAQLLARTDLPSTVIAKITGMTPDAVKDMKRGKTHKRFMKRAAQ